jgi:hypothetical protein
MVACERESKLNRKRDRTPRRTLDKQEAIRHLIHTAIRLIATREDPFAIHVLVHSADKMLVDMARNRGRELRMDWELYIKPEYHKEFFARHRAIYNYFKHADKDFDYDLPVHDIMNLNMTTLLLCVSHYHDVFGELTRHMWLHIMFVMALLPEMIVPTTSEGIYLLKNIRDMSGMTPSEFFTLFEENTGLFPGYIGELTKDREDIGHFYNLSFAELRAGETKSPRIFQIREY